MPQKTIPIEQGLKRHPHLCEDAAHPWPQKTIPIEQGLKRNRPHPLSASPILPQKTIPIEQGLKQRVHTSKGTKLCSSEDHSNRTRIETVSQSLVAATFLPSEDHSNRTRIETARADSWRRSTEPSEDHSNRTRIETCRVCQASPSFFSPQKTIPIEQGLKH